ncbi:nuclear transport factor 2 family protein [Actinokineospora iranica]|uniref:Ketosteroid isomerase-related protein n=1 Tax=Actinokineospora iranica TaxID=1271860 RepID=A0A1G6S866_9PSEU|nr:nuclear transport factor 2 family protein [Actinokineospora iranica]SDD13029.1 Ketosteroid isomerase-related protein [Actinokineospora iranica]
MNKQAVRDLVDRYIAIWNETDENNRQAMVDAVFTPDALYVDPNTSASGTAAIGQYIAAATRNFTGMRFTVGTVLTHHDAVHFSWQVGPATGAPAVSGYDVALFRDGRVTRLHGFFNGY